MDFSVVLILPLAAIVAFVTLLAIAALKRPKPRLMWPFAISTLAAISIFLRLPQPGTQTAWIFSVLMLAVWAAFGTIVGAVVAKLVIAAASSLRQR